MRTERGRQMTRSIRLAAALAVVLIGSTVVAFAEVEEVFDQTYPIAPDGRISLDNVNGDVTVEVWDQAEVRVSAVKRAGDAERLAALKIEVTSRDRSLDIHTELPSSRGWGWGDHGRTEVEYTLTVPRGARLDGFDLVNGDLRIGPVEGGIEVDSVNGRVEIEAAFAPLELSTVNGTMDIRLARLEPGADVDLDSVNGRIELALPPGAGAELDVETVNGSIRNDFGLEVHKGKYVGSDLRADLNGGGARVAVETVNGSIRLTDR